jgi:tripartite ATP-independent transporter DctM subunit
MALHMIVIIAILMVALFIGTPVSNALGITAVVVMLLFMGPQHLLQFGNVAFRQGTNMNMLVAPLFILMAEFLSRGDIAADIYEMLNRALKKLKGGLAISTTLACTIFAALCGSSPATAASIGRMSISQMTTRNYAPSFAVGTVAAGGTLGLMIPPSIAFVTYGIITENSIAKLLMAGLLPGIMLSALLCVSIIIRVRLNPSLAGEAKKYDKAIAVGNDERGAVAAAQVKAPEEQRSINILATLPAFALIIVVLGALYAGVATPTEAAGYGAVGAMVIVFAKRRLSRKMFTDILTSTAKTSCLILFLIIMGFCLSYAISYLGLAQQMANAIIASGLSKWTIMILLYVLWFVLGCLMDPGSMIILTIPFVYPTIIAMGIDPIWLGVVSTLCVEIGMITPPVGLNLFILRSVAENISMSEIIKGALPYVIVLLIGLVILTIFPQIALFLPSRM